MTSPTLAAEQPKVLGLPATVLLAVACGLGVGNSYYAQPLIGPISQSLGLAPQLSGLIVAATQMGYAAGLILIVPLGDLIENRRLISLLLTTAGLALLGLALAPSSASFLAAGLIVGTASAGTQVIIALAGGLVPDGRREESSDSLPLVSFSAYCWHGPAPACSPITSAGARLSWFLLS